MRIKSFCSANKYIFIAFAVPVLITVLAFAVTGIYPFGDQQIAVIDMYHQYVPFLSELQSKLQNGDSLFYTWNGAAGSNFWNLMAYYCASPLNLLLAVFPAKYIMEATAFILLIKIGLTGSFMTIYLRYTDNKCNMLTVAFASLYALSSYVMGYYWCIMWMDAVMLLPLIMLGLNRLIDDGRFVLYTATLALTVFCNYYMAIMVCIFIMFYYPVLYFLKVRKGGTLKCVKTTGKAVGFSLLGVVMAAVMLLPTYISMQDTFYISADMPEKWAVYSDVLDVLNQVLPNAQLTYRDGLPNLYCGLIVVILLIFYFMSKTTPLREKALNTGFLAFMFLSLNLNKLDFMWHGFHFPNQLPFRYTFVICFILIGIAYKTFSKIDEVKIQTLWRVLAIGAAYLIFAQKIFDKNIDNMPLFVYGGIAWLALYIIVMILYRKGTLYRTSFYLLIVVLIFAELTANTCTSFDKVGNSSRVTYFENWEDVSALAEYTNEEFVRAEMDDTYILNCPAFYQYKGVSQFSSSINSNTTAIMEKIGVEGEPGKNRFNYNLTNPVTNAMLNVKYIITKNLEMKDRDFKEIKVQNHSVLYENKYPLSVGYMVDDAVRTWNYDNDNPYIVLEDYLRATAGKENSDVFQPIDEAEISTSNVDVTSEGGGHYTALLHETNKKSKVVLEYESTKTQNYYVFVESPYANTIIVNKGDTKDDIEIRDDCGSIVNIGEIPAGKTFRVIIDYQKGKIGNIRCHVSRLNYDTWEKAYNILSSNMMEVTEWSDNHIKGTVDVKEDGILVTSIPYEKGWKLEVDGYERSITELTGGSFISVALAEGEHEIYLKFTPPGFAAGIAISAGSIILLAVLEFIRRKKLSGRSALPDSDEVSDCSRDIV